MDMKKLKFYIAIVLLFIIFHSCDISTKKEKTVDELKTELKAKEQVDPTQYLSAQATLKENVTQRANLFHHTKTDGYILAGSIKNSSTIAKFKDVVIEVIYLSETEREMETKEYIMDKFFTPSSTTDFEYKVYPPAGFKDFSIQVKTATAAD
jgi:hypothetical protein